MKKQRSRRKTADLSDSLVLRRASNIIQRVKSDGSLVIMRVNEYDYFVSIDKIAAKIWTMIDGKASVSQIKRRILRRHPVQEKRFDRDFSRLIQRLRALKLLER